MYSWEKLFTQRLKKRRELEVTHLAVCNCSLPILVFFNNSHFLALELTSTSFPDRLENIWTHGVSISGQPHQRYSPFSPFPYLQ
jgi:hypothetical protein